MWWLVLIVRMHESGVSQMYVLKTGLSEPTGKGFPIKLVDFLPAVRVPTVFVHGSLALSGTVLSVPMPVATVHMRVLLIQVKLHGSQPRSGAHLRTHMQQIFGQVRQVVQEQLCQHEVVGSSGNVLFGKIGKLNL